MGVSEREVAVPGLGLTVAVSPRAPARVVVLGLGEVAVAVVLNLADSSVPRSLIGGCGGREVVGGKPAHNQGPRLGIGGPRQCQR